MLKESYFIKLRETVIPSMKEAADKGFTQGGMSPLGYDYLQLKEGTMYVVLKRLENNGLVESYSITQLVVGVSQGIIIFCKSRLC